MPTFVYGNWASYDELSDNIPLNEDLALNQLNHLLRLRTHGVRFDAYLMDAFWFAEDGAYRTWRKPDWPNGPDRWLEECQKNELLPGLWFTANTLFHLDLPPAWKDSIDNNNWGMCCYQGGFLDDFMEALRRWYERGIRLFKLDFADFNAVPKAQKGQIDPKEARTRNIESYRRALTQFKKDCPQAILMAYNGFEDRECMDRSDRPPGHYIDPKWLEVFDCMYPGDPRPSDLPCPDFWRSVDIYSDCLTRLFESSGIPLDRIDNCAFMAGPTGTCYWRGKAGWKEMLVLSLARGGKYHVAYGDLSLFNEQDAKFWTQAQTLYNEPAESFGGWPGAGEPYGWKSKNVLTLVNPGLKTTQIDTPQGQVTLNPGQILILPPHLDLPSPEPDTEEPIAQAQGSPGLQIPLGLKPGRYRLVVTQKDQHGAALRNYPTGDDVPPFKVMLEVHHGTEILDAMTTQKIWSGLSWWLVDFDLMSTPATLTIDSTTTAEAILTAEIYLCSPPKSAKSSSKSS
jgi:hypothetical protein